MDLYHLVKIFADKSVMVILLNCTGQLARCKFNGKPCRFNAQLVPGLYSLLFSRQRGLGHYFFRSAMCFGHNTRLFLLTFTDDCSVELINLFCGLIKLDTVFAQLCFCSITGSFRIFQTLLDIDLSGSQRTLDISLFECPDDNADKNGKIEYAPAEIFHLPGCMVGMMITITTLGSKTCRRQQYDGGNICQRDNNFLGTIGHHLHNYRLLPRIFSQISPDRTSACFFSSSRASP